MAKSKTYKAALAKMPRAAGIFEIIQPIMAYNSKMGDNERTAYLMKLKEVYRQLVLVGEVIDITLFDYWVMNKQNSFGMAPTNLQRKPDLSDLIAQGKEPRQNAFC